MKASYGIDTNVLIYYLTGTPERKSKECMKLIKKAENEEIKIKVAPIIFWEASWVLEHYFKNSKREIIDVLKKFLRLDGIECKKEEILLNSFDLWEKESIDFADAYIIEFYQDYSVKGVYSYDRHLQQKNIECLIPGEEQGK